jgi:hypothetical protein
LGLGVRSKWGPVQFPFTVAFHPLTQLPSFPGDEPSGVIDYGGTSWATFPDVFGAMPSAPSQTTLDGTASGGGTVLVNIDLLALDISAADIDAGGVTLDFSAVQNFVRGGPYLQLRAFGLPDPHGLGGLWQAIEENGRGGDRGDLKLHGRFPGAFAPCQTGGHRQPAAG